MICSLLFCLSQIDIIPSMQMITRYHGRPYSDFSSHRPVAGCICFIIKRKLLLDSKGKQSLQSLIHERINNLISILLLSIWLRYNMSCFSYHVNNVVKLSLKISSNHLENIISFSCESMQVSIFALYSLSNFLVIMASPWNIYEGFWFWKMGSPVTTRLVARPAH